MSVQIISKAQQGQGAFNGGEIVENKPIGFPREGSLLRPFSNLFYWAHAKGVVDSTIGLHPHQGFEICSFVLKGEIRHYDTKLKEWRPLQAGDVQIIRAGNGISHSEWMGKGAEMFQIWFDPNLQKTLDQPASYDDYKANTFPVTQQDGVEVTTVVGEGSPFRMDTPDVEVIRIKLNGNTFNYTPAAGQTVTAYLLSGTASVNNEAMVESDFALIKAATEVQFEASENAELFIMAVPENTGYRTYAQQRF